MKQLMNMVRKTDFERNYINGLKVELDYELSSLYEAMKEKNTKEIKRSKQRLGEIHSELEAFHAFA